MPNLERTLVRQFEMPNETDRAALDRMCSSYGFVASKFLFAFQTRELRSEVKDFRAFRNRLVTALSRAPVEFNQKLAGLRANGKTAEATLLTLLRELKETSGPHLQARHLKLALEETSKMALTHWKSVIAESKKELADTLKRFHDQDRHYAYWLLCGINRQFFELLDGRIPVPNPEVSFDRNYCLSYERPLSLKTLRCIAGIVRRTVNRVRRNSVCYPRTKTFHNRIDFDSSCYTVRSAEDAQLLELMSLQPGKRISLRLKGKSKIRGTLQLIRDTAGTYSLRVYVPQQCEERRKFNPLMLKAQARAGGGCTGDGILMAMAYGADTLDTEYIKATFCYPANPRHSGSCQAFWSGAIITNKKGKRIVDESVSYKLLGDAALKEENGIAYIVFDEPIRQKRMKAKLVEKKWMELYDQGKEPECAFRGNTIEEVAIKAGLDPKGLKETITRYNSNIDNKIPDPDFNRTSINSGSGELVKIETGPFYIYPATARLIATYCGVKINTKAEVLNVFGEKIPHLYACGEMTGGVHGAAYMTGSSIGKAMAFGRIAVKSMMES